MSDQKLTNTDAVRKYHKQISNMATIRVPAANAELGIPDYKKMITEHAESLGLSMNNYILSLIEKDMNIQIIKGIKEAKKSKSE